MSEHWQGTGIYLKTTSVVQCSVFQSLGCMRAGGAYCYGMIHMGNKGGVRDCGGSRGDSHCEIPMEGNWNSIGVRSWLLP